MTPEDSAGMVRLPGSGPRPELRSRRAMPREGGGGGGSAMQRSTDSLGLHSSSGNRRRQSGGGPAVGAGDRGQPQGCRSRSVEDRMFASRSGGGGGPDGGRAGQMLKPNGMPSGVGPAEERRDLVWTNQWKSQPSWERERASQQMRRRPAAGGGGGQDDDAMAGLHESIRFEGMHHGLPAASRRPAVAYGR
eukprot:SAG22_NODE_1866_length_3405_cov_5.505594_2_plen_191_part_00